MAVPLLATARPAAYGPLLVHWHETPDAELHRLEVDEFGWNHSAVGASIAERWGLPETLATGIDNHHDSDDPSTPAAIRLVGHIREVDSDGVDRLVERCRAEFNLPPETILPLIDRAEDAAAAIAAGLR